MKLQGPQALLLAYADGSKTVEDLLALTDLSERQALATLRGLELLGVLEERPEAPSRRHRITFGL
jgi:Fic family protein